MLTRVISTSRKGPFVVGQFIARLLPKYFLNLHSVRGIFGHNLTDLRRTRPDATGIMLQDGNLRSIGIHITVKLM